MNIELVLIDRGVIMIFRDGSNYNVQYASVEVRVNINWGRIQGTLR